MEKQIKFHDLDVKYEVIHRDIRCPRFEFKTGVLQVIVPREHIDVEELIDRHRNWIYRTATLIHDALSESHKRALHLARTDEQFRDLVSSYVNIFSEILRVYPNKITFRRMKSRWGSCSGYKRNITINTHLRYLPNHTIGYVVLHELTHLLEGRHNQGFWQKISRIYPDYKDVKKELLMYWYLLQDNGLLK